MKSRKGSSGMAMSKVEQIASKTGKQTFIKPPIVKDLGGSLSKGDISPSGWTAMGSSSKGGKGKNLNNRVSGGESNPRRKMPPAAPTPFPIVKAR